MSQTEHARGPWCPVFTTAPHRHAPRGLASAYPETLCFTFTGKSSPLSYLGEWNAVTGEGNLSGGLTALPRCFGHVCLLSAPPSLPSWQVWAAARLWASRSAWCPSGCFQASLTAGPRIRLGGSAKLVTATRASVSQLSTLWCCSLLFVVRFLAFKNNGPCPASVFISLVLRGRSRLEAWNGSKWVWMARVWVWVCVLSTLLGSKSHDDDDVFGIPFPLSDKASVVEIPFTVWVKKEIFERWQLHKISLMFYDKCLHAGGSHVTVTTSTGSQEENRPFLESPLCAVLWALLLGICYHVTV